MGIKNIVNTFIKKWRGNEKRGHKKESRKSGGDQDKWSRMLRLVSPTSNQELHFTFTGKCPSLTPFVAGSVPHCSPTFRATCMSPSLPQRKDVFMLAANVHFLLTPTVFLSLQETTYSLDFR